jgi:ssDNA-binding Zn-finger/Zn-ribbon topoisomerase 1
VSIEYADTREAVAERRLAHNECPKCGEPLNHFSGLEDIPAYDYCPKCLDWAYIPGSGRRPWQTTKIELR